MEAAVALHERAVALVTAGDLRAARSAVVRALRRMRDAVGPDHPDVANILDLRGHIAMAEGDVARARRCFRRAARIVAQLDPSPDTSRIHVQATMSLGQLEREVGRYRRAGLLLRRAVAIATAELDTDDLDTAAALNALGMWCKYTGRFATGRRCYLRALAILERRLGREHPELAVVYHNLGGLEHERRNFARGERYARRSVALRRAAEGESTPAFAADSAALAVIIADRGRLDEAEPLYRSALSIFERIHGEDHHEVAVILHNLGALYAQRGDTHAAEIHYTRAAAIKRAVQGDDHPDLALTRYNLAVLLHGSGRFDESRPLCDAALRVFDHALAPTHPTRLACRALAESLRAA
ncbi:kinesin light chain-like protein [Minicystis rosea]|nr:kinesin light chain-like protein [Minicystis rosea]